MARSVSFVTKWSASYYAGLRCLRLVHLSYTASPGVPCGCSVLLLSSVVHC